MQSQSTILAYYERFRPFLVLAFVALFGFTILARSFSAMAVFKPWNDFSAPVAEAVNLQEIWGMFGADYQVANMTRVTTVFEDGSFDQQLLRTAAPSWSKNVMNKFYEIFNYQGNYTVLSDYAAFVCRNEFEKTGKKVLSIELTRSSQTVPTLRDPAGPMTPPFFAPLLTYPCS